MPGARSSESLAWVTIKDYGRAIARSRWSEIFVEPGERLSSLSRVVRKRSDLRTYSSVHVVCLPFRET